MNKTYEELGIKLRQYRKEKNLSSEKFAEQVGISAGLVNNIENAKYDVFKLDLLGKIIKKLGVPPSDVLKLYYLDEAIDINLPSTEDYVITLCNQHAKLILNSYITTITEYGCTEENISIISTHIQQELETLRKLHRANSRSLEK